MLVIEKMQKFNMIYFVILCMSQINPFEDIYFLGSLGYLVLYKKNICILRGKKLINS
jgi:hypothetical protein